MIEVLSEDYVRTSRAKGLTERVVVWRHALRNTLAVDDVNLGGHIAGSHHAGQHRRIEEAAEAHGDGHRDRTGKGCPDGLMRQNWRALHHAATIALQHGRDKRD